MENAHLIQNKCKTCGAPMADPNAQRCSYCMMPQQENSDQQAFLCSNCGSYLDHYMGGFKCAYCKSTFSLNDQTGLDKAFFGKQEKLDLEVSQDQAKTAFYEWLAKNDLSQGEIESIEIKPLYVPYMIATIKYQAIFSADIGQETWGPYVEINGVEKKRKVMEWQTVQDHFESSSIKSYLITTELSLEVQSFAKKVECKKFMERARALKNEERENGSYLTVSPKSVEAITRIVKKHIPISAKKLAKSKLSSSEVKELNIDSLKYEMASDYLYVPFWQVFYKYKGKNFQVLITGMDRTELVIDGSRPTIEKARTIAEKKEVQSYKNPFSFTILLIFLAAIAIFKPIRLIISVLLGVYLLGCLATALKNAKAKKNNL
ncbi:hypothetical protein [Enterococcus sp. AZ192]|uniref:hypothetical protein n=1 Tax=unclassified Enterococcus TaxID=2608891 RepID=UPI003D2E8E78